MNLNDKINMLKHLYQQEDLNVGFFYDILEKCDVIKYDYKDYMITNPTNCDEELKRLPTANYNLCCALITMLLREDHFSNGSFEKRLHSGQVQSIIKRIIILLSQKSDKRIDTFSEKSLEALNGYYVYALIDPRNDKVFYIGKGIGNRVFSHEIEYEKSINLEKDKINIIREINKSGFKVKRLIINWGLNEKEAFIAEATLINLLKYSSYIQLTNEVSGHHVHECLTTEEFDLLYGATPLEKEDIRHNILVIKINKLYRKDMSEEELYNAVRGYWVVSLNSIQSRNIEYVFGVYNGLIVAVYKPDEWHYGYEMVNAPPFKSEEYERLKKRLYFVCKDYTNLDSDGKFYLHKSIIHLKAIKSAQNPITYLTPEMNHFSF